MNDSPEEAEPALEAAPAARAVSPATLAVAAMIVVAALAIVGLGGYMLGGLSGGGTGVEAPDLDAGDVGGRVEDLGGEVEGTEVATQERDGGGIPGAEDAAESSPADEAFAALLAEEQERLAERARLASDSALTPPVTDTTLRVEQWRTGEQEPAPASDAQAAAPSGADPDSAPAGPEVASPGAAPPVSPIDGGAATHLLSRGSVIPAVLESSIDSELPGLVRAKVAEPVYDTLSGAHVLIPRGSWLVGTYGSNTRSGQRRLFVSWTDMLLPDGTPVPLGGTGSLGADGASGVKGRRSTGLWTALGASVLFDLAGNASQILIAAKTGEAPVREGGLSDILGAALGNSTSEVSERYLGEILERGTRFRVDAGARMNVLVEEDMHLPAQSVRGER